MPTAADEALVGMPLLRYVDAYLPILAMAAILSVCGWLVGGVGGIIVTGALVATLILVTPRLSPQLVMRLSGAYPLPPPHAPRKYAMLERLARAAGLEAVPVLHLVHLPAPTIFSVGNAGRSAIALSDGLLAVLDDRETYAVMAHEIAHIAANDSGLMRAAEILARITSFIATVGLLGVIVGFFLTPGGFAPFWAFWFLAASPVAISLLQLALSRRREFAADGEAVRLTGEAAALAAALVKIETATRWSLQRLFGDLSGVSLPSLLRTHPSTRERVARLLGNA